MKVTSTLKSHSLESLRRMTVWCAREIGISTRKVKLVTFAHSRSVWGGLCHGPGRAGIRLGRKNRYPISRIERFGRQESYEDDWEVLVDVTAHELAHCDDWQAFHAARRAGIKQRRHTTERSADRQCRAVLDKFRERRSELLTEWTATPIAKPAKEKPSTQERRAAIAEKKLAEWQRKLKLAQTKVKQYRTKCRYYQRAAASKAAKNNSGISPL